ncbi:MULTISPECIES: hypothetical protein [unclassified Nocardia]|uniref:hypothetical protein n=1 Tax=unclassified Nocardia TaxID=2637762 RepID=UPI00278BDE3F|nr:MULTISPECIES: hypothetical protein [unclassified Nocardia]
MPCDDSDRIELQVIVDVLDTIDARLRAHERHGWRLTAPRTHIYAAVLHAVIRSARATHVFPPTLDRAAILDTIFDGIEPSAVDDRCPVTAAIADHTVNTN